MKLKHIFELIWASNFLLYYVKTIIVTKHTTQGCVISFVQIRVHVREISQISINYDIFHKV